MLYMLIGSLVSHGFYHVLLGCVFLYPPLNNVSYIRVSSRVFISTNTTECQKLPVLLVYIFLAL